jgi:protein-disulfide isomerase
MTPTSPSLTLPVSDRDHIQGSPNAAVTLVEYGDYECPHCGRAVVVVEELREQFAKELRFVFRHFPLTQIHSHAQLAAEAAEAAGEQDHFWEMHETLFKHQKALDASRILKLAGGIGIDATQFTRALEAHTFQAHVREDFMSGVRSGVNGTPTFFINGRRYDGPVDLSSLSEAVQEAVKEVTR